MGDGDSIRKNLKKRDHVSAKHSLVTPEECAATVSSSNKYHPRLFGKVGMRYFHKLRNKFYCPIINVDKLWSLAPKKAMETATPDKAPLLNVTQFRYFKVLGKGMLPSSKPIVVKAKLAPKKIIDAGGSTGDVTIIRTRT